MGKTFGFYQYFAFDRILLSKAFRCLSNNLFLTKDELAACMGVNSPKAEGFIGWLTHTGLISRISNKKTSKVQNYELTPFGQSVIANDPLLTDPGTSWLLHYFLTTEHLEYSAAWYVLFNEFISIGVPFTLEQYQKYICNVKGFGESNRTALEKDPGFTLKTYTTSEALGRLDLIKKEPNQYRPGAPVLPEPYILAFMLFDWWERHHNDTNTIRFSQIVQDKESLGRICLSDDHQLRIAIRELSSFGFLSFSGTQHEPVNRLIKDSPYKLLTSYYEQL